MNGLQNKIEDEIWTLVLCSEGGRLCTEKGGGDGRCKFLRKVGSSLQELVFFQWQKVVYDQKLFQLLISLLPSTDSSNYQIKNVVHLN